MGKEEDIRTGKPGRVRILPESAENVKALMNVLEQDQAGLAAALGLSGATISAWVRGDRNRPPSPNAYLRMAKLASGRDKRDLATWFLRAAGVEIETLLDLRIGAVQQYLKSQPTGETITLIGTDVGGMFGDGETVILDKSANESEDLKPFWGEIILVEFGDRSTNANSDLTWRNLPPQDRYIGRLSLMRSLYHPLLYLAVLECKVTLHPTWGRGDPGVCIGGWLYKQIREEMVTPKDRARALMLADENVRPYKDSKILGRVEQWVASPRAMAGAMKRRTDAAKRH